MGSFTKGDIVLFPFPFTDLSNRKMRPCLVLSEEMEDDLILCQITSKNTFKDNFSIELKNSELLEGSLVMGFYIRCNMIFTASKSQKIKKICKINRKKDEGIINLIIKIIK